MKILNFWNNFKNELLFYLRDFDWRSRLCATLATNFSLASMFLTSCLVHWPSLYENTLNNFIELHIFPSYKFSIRILLFTLIFFYSDIVYSTAELYTSKRTNKQTNKQTNKRNSNNKCVRWSVVQFVAVEVERHDVAAYVKAAQ